MSDEALQEARDLVALAKSGALAPVHFRDALAAQALEQLDRKRSILLVGPPGVGKTAVIHALAQKMAARGKGNVFELSTALMLAGTRYIGEWQTKVTSIATAASGKGAALYVSDAWNLPKCGRTVQNDNNMLDALKPFVESGRLSLVAEATPDTLRAMQRVPGFVRLFQTIDVSPLSEDEVHAALDRAAAARHASLDSASRRALVKLTTRFQAARPQPGPALALLSQVTDYLEEKRRIGEEAEITPGFIEKVFSITSGLPGFVVSRDVTMPASEIRAWFAERIVGQEKAIEAVVEAIALFKSGLHDPSKPIGTFLFVGPTGVGKTEIARALATFIFGSPQRMLRFDLSEFKDYSSFEMLLGDPQQPDKPARLLDPVRAHPFQVVLFDELEKAHPNVWDLLLPLLDEGRLTAPGGDTVDFRNTVLIATSNVGAQDAEMSRSLGFGAAGADDAEKQAKIRRALEGSFRPEFLNRFQHVVVFHALSLAQMRRVARHEMQAVLAREGITGRELVVDVDDDAIDLVIARGVDTRFGARALKREVQRQIVLPIAMTLMEKSVAPGAILKVGAKDGELRVRVVETEASRASRESEPAPRRSATRQELLDRMKKVEARIGELATDVREEELEPAREKLYAERATPDFWKDIPRAERVQRELDRIAATAERLERLRSRAADLRRPLADPSARALKLEQLSSHFATLEEALDDARRELVTMGWDAQADAIVEVRPVGATGPEARDMLVQAYLAWAEHRRMIGDWLRDPRDDAEPALIAFKGSWAYGMLRGEAGLHRLRLSPGKGQEHGRLVVACVRVARWGAERGTVVVSGQRPLKAVGQSGGKVRSRLEVEGSTTSGPLVLQNARSLAENRELAADLVASWSEMPPAPEDVVRRYDRSPPLLRDALTSFSSGRPDALSPRQLDALLKLRIDARASSARRPPPREST